MAWLALAGAVVVMGGQFAVAKRGLAAGLTAYDIVALRFVGAAITAAVILAWRGAAPLAAVGWRRAVVLTVIAGSPYALLMYEAMRLAPAAHGAMLIPGVGLVVATLAGAWVGERHGAGRYAAVAVVVTGLVVLGIGSAAASRATALGDLLLTVAGLAWGLFTLLVRRWRLDALAATAVLSLLSLAYLPVWAVALQPRVAAATLGAILLQAGYQGVLQTAFAFAAYGFAVRRLGAGTAAIGSAAIPVVGTLLAIPLAGEWPTASTWAGLITVVVGLAVANVASFTLRRSADLTA
jgi:drug/metabolite transporter (DMT)-like permease